MLPAAFNKQNTEVIMENKDEIVVGIYEFGYTQFEQNGRLKRGTYITDGTGGIDSWNGAIRAANMEGVEMEVVLRPKHDNE